MHREVLAFVASQQPSQQGPRSAVEETTYGPSSSMNRELHQDQPILGVPSYELIKLQRTFRPSRVTKNMIQGANRFHRMYICLETIIERYKVFLTIPTLSDFHMTYAHHHYLFLCFDSISRVVFHHVTSLHRVHFIHGGREL